MVVTAFDELGDECHGYVDVDDGYAEHEQREGEGGGDTSEDGHGDGEEAEEGDDESVDGVEEGHDVRGCLMPVATDDVESERDR